MYPLLLLDQNHRTVEIINFPFIYMSSKENSETLQMEKISISELVNG